MTACGACGFGPFVVAVALDILKGYLPTLFRVAQEAIHNACKHAHTRRLRVTLQSRDASVYLAVRDWGQGFDPTHLALADYYQGELVETETLMVECAALGRTASV